ncbi:MAG: nucleotidyltransferase domain-containing protein [Clostridiales bacterium]|nr:nucleotidyltransferase domain-containing protein [Clostridiales bacterium]
MGVIRQANKKMQSEMLAATQELVAVLARCGAELVVLFGSLTDTGRATVDSDVDLVVVMPGVERCRFHERLRNHPAVEGFPYPLHLHVYTPAEWVAVRERAFMREEVLGKGVVLYERDG